MGKFGANPYTAAASTPVAPAAPATPRPAGRFGANPFSALVTPTGQAQTLTAAALLQSARAKIQNGGQLTQPEAQALAAVEGDRRALSFIGAALQPLLAPSDIIKGVASDVKADVTGGGFNSTQAGGNRGMAAAISHLTYGLAERLPGMAGARTAGVSGAELLKGTKYEGSAKAALAVELLSDPSLVLGGAGLIVKGAATAAKLAPLEKFAATAAGRASLQDIIQTANTAGTKLLHLSDEATGIPVAARAVGGSGAGQAVRAKVSTLADTTMPAPFQKALGVRTYGDAFLTPDQKAAAYTAAQLKRDNFRDTTRLSIDDLGSAVTRSAVDDAKVVGDLVKGLKPADASEVNRLLGVFSSTTDRAVAAEALRKLSLVSTRTGLDLEPAFVAAHKAIDRISQVTLGQNLAARGLPAVIDPAVTKAVQAAQSGDDLLPLIGAYKTAEGRPRGVLMTQYQGRGNLDQTINALEDAPAVPASSTLDRPAVTASLDRAATELPEIPPAPVAPVGVRPAAEPPINPQATAERVIQQPTVASPALGAAPAARSPAEVMDELFGGSSAAKVSDAPTPVNTPAPRVSESDTPTPAPRSPAEVLDQTVVNPPAPRAAQEIAPPVDVPALPAPRDAAPDLAAPAPDPAPPAPTPAVVGTLADTPKTPAEVLDSVLNPVRPQAGYAAPADFSRTPQADLKAVSGVNPLAPDVLVSRSIPTTYRTVSIDPSALDWAALPDQAARRAVANVLGGELTRTAAGGFKYSADLAEVPLSHPVISHYFDDATLEAARFPGSGYGERVISGRQQVPDWYDPKDPRPLDLQRAEREAAQTGDLNNLPAMERTANELNTGNLDSYIVGNAYLEDLRSGRPITPADFPRAGNDYAQRVLALNGRAATPAEVFGYRQRLARWEQQARLRTVNYDDVTTHLTDYFAQHPEATLYEATQSAAKQFGLGRGGRVHMQNVLDAEGSGFERQMSSLERAEFAGYLKAGQRSSVPGGSLTSRMLRNPQEVSARFQQVFAQEVDALRLATEQVQRGTQAIMQAEQMNRYHRYLTESGQHYTARQLTALQARPAHLLTPDELKLRTEVGFATEQAGRVAGWKIMDRNYGPFQVGDAVPWWAYHDIFGASSVQDAAVSGRIIGRGGWDTYDRLWASQNAVLLSSPSSIVTDQIGQMLQMVMYGVTPDEIINGLIRRATAKPGAIDAMRESGIASAKLESNLSVDGAQLRALARRLEGETDMTRMQRVIDGIVRFREYGSGVDRAALSSTGAKVAADVTHLGSAYLFQLRSAMSDLQRESLYFHYLSTGKTPTQAAAAANEVLLDMRLAPAYARVVGRFWPFFRWIAMSGPRSIVNVLRKPSISYAWNRGAELSDEATDNGDGKQDARRLLSRPNSLLLGTAGNGWLNLGIDERGQDGQPGARVYLDPRNWDPNNTIPQLLDWSGTKVGAVSLPWYATLVNGLQNGVDRNGLPVYRDALNGQPGGGGAAFQNDPKDATREAVMYIFNQFRPSYAAGSTRAANLASSIVETAKLPDDGSKDVTIARTLTGFPLGRMFLNYLQHGEAALSVPLTGNARSPYSSPPPSMARAAAGYLFPLQAIQADQHQQGTAAAALNVGLLGVQNWASDERKRLRQMQAGGASPEELRAAQEQARREYQRRMQRLNVTNLVTK